MAIFEKLGFDNTNLCGFFHELGHYLDFNIFNTDDAAKLAMQKSLEKEVFNYINVLLNLKKPVQSIDDIKNLNGNFKTRVSHSLKAPFMNGVQIFLTVLQIRLYKVMLFTDLVIGNWVHGSL